MPQVPLKCRGRAYSFEILSFGHSQYTKHSVDGGAARPPLTQPRPASTIRPPGETVAPMGLTMPQTKGDPAPIAKPPHPNTPNVCPRASQAKGSRHLSPAR